MTYCTMELENLLKEIGALDFDGHNRVGPRRDFIFNLLKKFSLNPHYDYSGNIWVERGKQGNYTLYSSHIDVDRTKGNPKPVIELKDEYYCGILDNAVGCYLNILSALKDTDSRSLHLFTASEEEQPGNPSNWCNSARDIIKVLKEKGIQPEISLILDVTSPKLLVPLDRLEELDDKLSFLELYDIHDLTPCYLDLDLKIKNGKIAEKMCNEWLKKMEIADIKTRDFGGWDESVVYNEISPSVSFGPVCYGKFDEPNQIMPIRNLEIAYQFLINKIKKERN